MLDIGQGGEVVDVTGEGVRLRPLAHVLSDESWQPAVGSWQHRLPAACCPLLAA